MSVLICFILFTFGLIFGSFIGALVWRLQKTLDDEGNKKKLSKKESKKYSIATSRSMCMHCGHELATKDLVPLFSWVWLKGNCRYCNKPIGRFEPIAELGTALLFVASYIFWPEELTGSAWVLFIGWLLTLVCLITLAIYDAKTQILPSLLIYVGIGIYIASLLLYTLVTGSTDTLIGAAIGGGIYFGLFFFLYVASYELTKRGISKSEWLGFGDVRLVFLLGLVVGSALNAFLAMFLACIIGIIIMLPGYVHKNVTLTSKIPFGPFLISGAIVTVWWGNAIIDWYTSTLLGL
jgi:prepilin signal peptidase PulO-like enzyme (type II secretory pathway)